MKRHQRAKPVTSLTYYLTEACNLRCEYCYLKKTPRRSAIQVGKAAVDFLTRESGLEPVVHLRFFGGEPLLELDLLSQVVAYAEERASLSGKKILFDMISNCTLLDTRAVRMLRDLRVDVIASVDGARKEVWAGKWLGEFANAIEEEVVRRGRVTLTPGQKRLGAFLERLLAMGFHEVQIVLATNIAWDETEIDALYRSMAAFYIEAARNGNVPPFNVTNELLLTRHEIVQGKHAPVRNRFCGAGRTMLGVGVDGALHLCHRFIQAEDPHALGDVFRGVDGARRRRWSGIDAETQRHEACRECAALDYCSGSCMAANYSDNGSLVRPEPRHCWDLRAHVRAVHHIYQTLTAEQNAVFCSFLKNSWRERRARRLASLLAEERAAP